MKVLNDNDGFQIFTLEEFLEKYPYKVGDKVRVPEFESEVRIDDMKWDGYNIQYEVFTDETEWYTAEELNNWNNAKNLKKEPEYKIGEKVIYDGDVVEIIKYHLYYDQYVYYFYHNGVLRSSSCYGLKSCKKVEPKNQNPILQQLKKYFEETPRDVIEKEWNELSYLNKIGPTVEEYLESVKKYRKSNQYPKTYGECRDALSLGEDDKLYTKGYKASLIQDFHKLIICRNAYWKIAGEQMGLGKPWRPSKYENVYCIFRFKGDIVKDNFVFGDSLILEFPTEEMRDAFLENFGHLIELCKELL